MLSIINIAIAEDNINIFATPEEFFSNCIVNNNFHLSFSKVEQSISEKHVIKNDNILGYKRPNCFYFLIFSPSSGLVGEKKILNNNQIVGTFFDKQKDYDVLERSIFHDDQNLPKVISNYFSVMATDLETSLKHNELSTAEINERTKPRRDKEHIVDLAIQNEISVAKEKYQESLNKLRNDPNNSNLRQETLNLGRKFCALTRNSNSTTIYDELMIMNDINSINSNKSDKSNNTSSIEERLNRLEVLKKKKLISDDEYQKTRKAILSEL